MRPLVALGGVSLVVLFACSSVAADECVLTAANAEVLAAKSRTSQTQFAVQELTNFLSRVFGAPVPVVSAPTAGRRQIVVGVNEWSAAEGLDPSALGKDDAFIIRATPERVYLCGVDGDWPHFCAMFAQGRGAGMLKGRRSSAFAVYEFLERYADCRFYWPGELGEIVPKAKEIRVPAGTTVHAPDLVIRKYYHPAYGADSPWKDNGWIEDNEFSEGKGMAYSWVRLRMGSFDIPCCHGINGFEFLRRFGKDHPEYFALKEDGSRFMTFAGYESSRHGMVCLSSGVMEELYRDLKSYLTGEGPEVRKIRRGWQDKWDWPTGFRERRYVDIMPNDSQYKCRCEKCRAKYVEKDRDPTGNFMTELVWGYTRDIASRMIREGVPGFVTQMAYAQYSRVPDFDLPTNVMVMVAKTGPFSVRQPEVLAADNAEIRKWKAKTGNVWIWTYPNKYGKLHVVGVPTMTPRAWGSYYKGIAPDVFGAFAESETDRFFFNHLNYYVFSRVLWDAKTDVDAVLDEYYRRCYGAAAPEAKRFCEELEDVFLDHVVGAYEMTPAGPLSKAASVREIWTDIYSPARLAAWSGLLDRGAAKLEKGSVEARRFKLFRDELLGVMRRTSDDYFERTDAAHNAKRYLARPPVRNLVDRKGAWYKLEEDPAVRIVSEKSIRVRATNGGATTLYYLDGSNGETLKPNVRYRISFFVKGENIVPTEPGGGAGLTLCDAFNNMFPKPVSLAGTFDWTYQSFEHRTAADTGARGRSYIYLRLTHANGTAWFDGITIEEIPDQVVVPGKCAVVVDAKADRSVRFAADTLARILSRRFSGKNVPVRSTAAPGEFVFAVGESRWSREAGIDRTKLPGDGFAVKSVPGAACIVGGAGKKSVLFGVCDFLEKIADCRFYFPGELGEVVRLGADLTVPNVDYTSDIATFRGSRVRMKKPDVPEGADYPKADFLNRMFGPSIVQWYMGEFFKKVGGMRAEIAAGRPQAEVCTEEALAALEKTLDHAAKSVRPDADPLISKRIELYRREVLDEMRTAK